MPQLMHKLRLRVNEDIRTRITSVTLTKLNPDDIRAFIFAQPVHETMLFKAMRLKAWISAFQRGRYFHQGR